MAKVIIIGGGPAGMMAAIAAARDGASAIILEKNEKLGKKLFITGKGRCNLTNACEKEDLFKNVTVNSRFLFSAFEQLDNHALMEFFENLGLKLKTERGKRVFPESDKSSDVIKVLKEELNDLNVSVFLNTEVKEISFFEDKVRVKSRNADGKTRTDEGDAVIVATGGLSYESTGSTGDGYRFAEESGHSVTSLVPSLVALETKEEFPKKLQGLSLKNVELTLENEKGKKIYSEIGEMLFTHFGISGPLVLSASTFMAEAKAKGKPFYKLFVDLKPGLSLDELDSRLIKDFGGGLNKSFRNSLDALLPQSMIPEMVSLSGIDPDKKVNSVTKEERQHLAGLLKKLEFTVTGLRGFNEAIITKGGISVKEINPKTMESKLQKNLYFAGEVMDLDAFTGGFNLQIAWSTGWAAGKAAAHKEGENYDQFHRD